MCSFCNQRSITGQAYQPTAMDVKNTLSKAVKDLGDRAENTEIAFFGGSFTAIDREYMLELIKAAKPFTDVFSGIRISTRPDCIDKEVLSLLNEYGVTSIELGAQSMDNSVLELNNRGHNARDVVNASKLIQKSGFSLGLQMMTGLYGSDFEKDIKTAEAFVALKPDTVRIYPTVIMKGTALEDYYKSGLYKPYTLEESVSLCSKLIMLFERENIKIIRLGLHYSDSLVQNSVYDNYHPAFKELCESRLFYNSFLELTKNSSSKNFDVYINPKSLSKFLGQKKSNIQKLSNLGYKINILFDSALDKYEIKLGESV